VAIVPCSFELPPVQRITTALAVSTYVLDASGEVAVLVFRPSKTGNLTRFEAWVAAIGNTPDNGLRFSFQDVSTSTGLQDGGVDQFATIASGSLSTGWMNPGDFNSPRAVTPASVVAAVIDLPTFVASDSVTIGAFTSTAVTVQGGFPYGISATSTMSSTVFPAIAVRYDDGTYDLIDYTAAYSAAIGSFNITTISTPDEFGNAFTLAYPLRVNRVALQAAVGTGANWDVNIYDASNNVIATGSSDGDVKGNAASRLHFVVLTAPVDLAANTLYRVVITPTTTTSSTVYYSVHDSLALMDTLPCGQAMYATQRTNAGAWTDFNNGGDGFRRAQILLGISGIDDGLQPVGRSLLAMRASTY
jgi:hypothetical protein